MFGFSFFKRGKKKEEVVNFETKIHFQKIQKGEESIPEKGEYFLDIATISKNKNEFEFVVNFENNTNNHIRLKILNIQLIHDGKEFEGDSFIYEMKMGTNDAILKNTVIAQGTLLKNILFKGLDVNQISGDDYIIIELLINDQPYVLENSINGSTVDQIKIIEIV